MRIDSILTILDKPKDAQTALERAIELQDLTSAHIDALAFSWHAMCENNEVFSVEQRRQMKKEILRTRASDARDLLTDAQANARNLNLKTAWTSDIAGWVTDAAAKSSNNLVVKSVHRSKTLAHTPLDWALLRTCPAPVLLTGKRRRKRSNVVLAALDLRHNDAKHVRLNKRVLDAASYFADLYGAKVHCVAAIEMSRVLQDLEIFDERKVAKKAQQKTAKVLDGLIKGYPIAKANVHYPIGKVGRAVAKVSHALDADLLVVGSTAHRYRQAVGLGNSAEQILQRVGCDVLSVHPA